MAQAFRSLMKKKKNSGAHLFSHIVTNIVPSAVFLLTVVFGMGTGVSRRRIDTGNPVEPLIKNQTAQTTLTFSLERR